MAISFEFVDTLGFADHASRILEEAWSPPALRYSPEYLRWQLSFPAPNPLPVVAAFDGSEPIGFAGVTARRLRFRSLPFDSGIVSFVSVRPKWSNRGVAAGLYARLLSELRIPIVTYALAGSAGERALLRAYPEAGFRVQSMGVYPVYGCLVRNQNPDPDPSWQAIVSDDDAPLAGIVERAAAKSDLIWNNPSPAQLAHYRCDPRPRRLILLKHGEFLRGAAWIVRIESRTAQGIENVTSVDSLFLLPEHSGALPALFRCAAACWPTGGQAPVVISAPSLYGFDTARLRQAGIRQMSAPFHAQLCIPTLGTGFETATGTNLEVI